MDWSVTLCDASRGGTSVVQLVETTFDGVEVSFAVARGDWAMVQSADEAKRYSSGVQSADESNMDRVGDHWLWLWRMGLWY